MDRGSCAETRQAQLYVALVDMASRNCYVPKPPHFFLSLEDSAIVGSEEKLELDLRLRCRSFQS